MNPAITEPRPYRWNREQFLQMLDLGWFSDQNVELFDGLVIELASQLDNHLASVTGTGDALRGAFGSGFWVRTQGSLDLSPHGIPSPDLAITRGSPIGASRTIAKSALLVVEVSETSLYYDREFKAPLYAAGGITDYWIVNLEQRQLELFRDPICDSTKQFGFRYNSHLVLNASDTVSPLAAPQASINVADLLP